MPYYVGDNVNYAAGDYYQGDPGLLGSLFGGIGKVVGGVLGATPVGAAAKAILPIFKGQPQQPQLPALPPPTGVQPRADVPFFPDITGRGIVLPEQMGPLAVCNYKGYHPNKSSYFTKGGGTSRYPPQILYHPKGTNCVRTRRMNVANPRALRRALRRAQGFAKLARRYIRVQHTFKKKFGKRKR